MKNEIFIPLVKSLISGFAIGSTVAAFLYGFRLMDGSDCITTGALVSVVSGSFYWLFGLSASGPGPGQGGGHDENDSEKNTPFMVTVYRENESYPEGPRFNLPIDRDQWLGFCEKLIPDFDTAENNYTGPGGIMTAKEFVKVRKSLMDAGLAYWKNNRAHSQGWKFNLVGQAFIRRSVTHRGEGDRFVNAIERKLDGKERESARG